MNYVSGALIYIKANYAKRIRTLLASWKIANKGVGWSCKDDGDEEDGLGLHGRKRMIAGAGEDGDDGAEDVDGAADEHRSDGELLTPVKMVMTESYWRR